MSWDELDQTLRQTLSILRKIASEKTEASDAEYREAGRMAADIVRQIKRLGSGFAETDDFVRPD
jgi:hypothetical protein